MIIFQTAGSGDAGGFRAGAHLLGRWEPLADQATTFRESDYIHRLNRTLQAEMRAVSAYRSLTHRQADRLAASHDAHQRAGKELVRLIIANRGIPEDRSALSFGLTRTVMSVVARVPSRFAARVTLGSLRRLEAQLVQSYRRLLTIAPARDLAALTELLSETERNAQAVATRSEA